MAHWSSVALIDGTRLCGRHSGSASHAHHQGSRILVTLVGRFGSSTLIALSGYWRAPSGQELITSGTDMLPDEKAAIFEGTIKRHGHPAFPPCADDAEPVAREHSGILITGTCAPDRHAEYALPVCRRRKPCGLWKHLRANSPAASGRSSSCRPRKDHRERHAMPALGLDGARLKEESW